MLTSFCVALVTVAIIIIIDVVTGEKRTAFNEDEFYLRRLDLFPEFLAEWEETVDKQILVARTTAPGINGVIAPVSEHNSTSADEWIDEWDEAEAEADEAYFASCQSEHPLSYTQI